MYLEFRDSENLSFSRPSDGVEGLTESVKSIIDDIRKRGDAALYDYALRFDPDSALLYVDRTPYEGWEPDQSGLLMLEDSILTYENQGPN